MLQKRKFSFIFYFTFCCNTYVSRNYALSSSSYDDTPSSDGKSATSSSDMAENLNQGYCESNSWQTIEECTA